MLIQMYDAHCHDCKQELLSACLQYDQFECDHCGQDLSEEIRDDQDLKGRVLDVLYQIADVYKASGDTDGEHRALAQIVKTDITFLDAARRFDALNQELQKKA